MLMTLFSLNLTLSLSFLLMSHPLSMGMILLFQTLMISLITGSFSLNFWFSYILFLILVGSMLILFIYMTSIASNEKFYFSKTQTMFMFMFPLILFFSEKMYLNSNIFNMDLLTYNKTNQLSMSMIKFLNFPSNLILLFLIIYLLLTLIAIVKITNFKHGPLRLKN